MLVCGATRAVHQCACTHSMATVQPITLHPAAKAMQAAEQRNAALLAVKAAGNGLTRAASGSTWWRTRSSAAQQGGQVLNARDDVSIPPTSDVYRELIRIRSK